MKRALRRDPPDALVVIDAGAFNVPLARWAKRQGHLPGLLLLSARFLAQRRAAAGQDAGLADGD